MNPVDFLAIGYFITSVTSKRSAAAYLKIDSINGHQAKLLLSELPILKYPVKVLIAAGALPLKLGVNEFSKESLPYIATSFPEQSPLITELMVKEGHFQEGSLTSFVKAMRTRSYLTRLQLQNINLECTQKDGNAFIEMLQWNKSLTHLDLSSNRRFSDFGAYCTFHGLQHNTALTYLNLSKTRMTDKGAVYIAQMLVSDCPLQTLDISYNCIGGYGFASIAKSLISSTALNHLYISFTEYTDTAANLEAVHAARKENKLQPITVTVKIQ